MALFKSLQSGFLLTPTPPFRLCFHFSPSTNPHSTIPDVDCSSSVITSLSFWADLSDSMRHDSARNWNPSFCAEQSSSPPRSPCLSVSLSLCTVHRKTFSCVSCGAIFSHSHFSWYCFLPLQRSSLTPTSSLQIVAFFFHVIHQRNDHRGLQFLPPAPCDVFRQFLQITEIRSCKCVFFLHLLSPEALALTKPILSPRGESLRKIWHSKTKRKEYEKRRGDAL